MLAATTMRPWLILLNNFCHDLFTGLWFGSFITLYYLYDRGRDEDAPVLGELAALFFDLCLLSLALVCVTGLFRFLYDRRGDGGVGDNWELKKQLLIVKHAFLGTSFVAGSVLGYLWTH